MRGIVCSLRRAVGETDLHAFVDGALRKRQRRQVELHLACHPEEAARVDGYERQLRLLQALRAERTDLPASPVLSELVRAFSAQLERRRRLRRLAAAVALVGLLSTAGLTGWLLSGKPQDGPSLTAEASDPAWLLHSSLVGETTPVATEQSDSLGWLGHRLGRRALHRPDLEALGLRYVSSTVLHATEPPVVRLIYEDALGKRLFIYIAVLVGEAEGVFGVVPEGYVSLQWRRGPLAFALIAPSDSPQLTATMDVVSRALVEEPISDSAVEKAKVPSELTDRVSQAAAESSPAPVTDAGGTVTPAVLNPAGAANPL
jgi:anti-sigma factor RsiW